MKNIQIMDGTANATFSIFLVSEEEFASIFPNESEMEVIEDFIERVGTEKAGTILEPIWQRPVLKQDALGIHGTLFTMVKRDANISRIHGAKWIGTNDTSIKPSANFFDHGDRYHSPTSSASLCAVL